MTLRAAFFARLITTGLILRMHYFTIFIFYSSHLLSSVRDAIREYHPRFSVTAHMWPAFLYPKGQYNPQRPSAGLFKGELLLRVCGLHFTRTI